jgi:tetratricopeptide (TPR) repeat protein
VRKRLLQTILLAAALLGCALQTGVLACGGGDYTPDTGFYNLFMQEIIDDARYYPFLLTEGGFYRSADRGGGKNENIEEWAAYLGIAYDDARRLVFDSASAALEKLLGGAPAPEAGLGFLTPEFAAKHKAALHYLVVAKGLEPYMSVGGAYEQAWDYGDGVPDLRPASDLDYDETRAMLQKEWREAPDKELKLRYGYQLVRFAHYSGMYDDAVAFFEDCVAPLGHTPPMYYHALSQKAGALRGRGDVAEANADFFRVFAHSNNLKEAALVSIRFTDDVSFQEFLEKAEGDQERNDAYLLLGFTAFSNPLNAVEKIVAATPDAIQAKVLMARAVNTLERLLLPTSPYASPYWLGGIDDYRDAGEAAGKAGRRRYPEPPNDKTRAFLGDAMRLSARLAESGDVKGKDFWLITSAYLHFLDGDYATARKHLGKVADQGGKYRVQGRNLGMYIDVSEPAAITPEVEGALFAKYRDLLGRERPPRQASSPDGTPEDWFSYSTRSFVRDVFANRYYLQKEYAKSFLLHHDIDGLRLHPDLGLLDQLEAFFDKPGKTGFEKVIVEGIYPYRDDDPGRVREKVDVHGRIDYIRGVVHLADADFDKALTAFSRMKKREMEIPRDIFGYNRIECFDCAGADVMATDYLEDFPYIAETMDEKGLADALVRLREAGKKAGGGDGELAAKANYLVGNFVYNTTRTGYYRGVTRFSPSSSHENGAYYGADRADILDGTYFMSFHQYHKNNVAAARSYLEKALGQAKDRELRARIVFALSKCELEEYYDGTDAAAFAGRRRGAYGDDDGILITDRRRFEELAGYDDTEFYGEVASRCKYFEYFINNRL